MTPALATGRRKRKQTPEGALLALVMEWLAAKHIYALRMNTGAIKTEGRFFRFGTKGCADILAFPQLLIHGPIRSYRSPFPVWLELKAGTKQSEAQKSFQAKVEDEGHKYILATCLDDVIEFLDPTEYLVNHPPFGAPADAPERKKI